MTIKDSFHEIQNLLNKVTIGAGVARETLGLEKTNSKLTDILQDIEDSAQATAGLIYRIKKILYTKLNPDSELPE
ncbi:MAG: hypothetical protein ABIH01_01130 [Candidatus Omnitrophota bacterium]